MNELNQGQTRSYELPTPVDGASSNESEAKNPKDKESQATPVPAMPSVDPAQLAQPVQLPLQDDQQATPVLADDDLDAHDLDVIEKEWVKKAKEIINITSNDPHKQKDDLDSFSADYLKKRYGKEIKLEG